MRVEFKYILVFIVFSVMSCGSKKGIVTKKKDDKRKEVVVKEKGQTAKHSGEVEAKSSDTRSAVEKYIDLYSGIAKDNMRIHKIPASITLAQGVLESGSGHGRLAVKANNHFGIKCHGWKGAKIYHDDDRSQECFRKYRRAETSYEDHSAFLTGRKRYAGLFKLNLNDYKGWAKGLKAAGYATDRKYPQKLISLIERYQLYKYDEEVLGKSKKTRILEKRSKIKHVVVKGETLYSLSRFYKITIEALKTQNNLTSNDLSVGQELIIRN